MKVVTESNARTYSHEHETLRKILGGVIGKDKGHDVAYETPTPSALNYTPNFDEVLSRSANIVFGKEERIKKPETALPGPGYYEAEVRSKITFGKATRHPNRS